MATHPVDLINSALVRLGDKTMTVAQYEAENLSSAPTVQRHWMVKRVFVDVLPRILRNHSWNCVTRRAELSEDTDNPPVWGFNKRYPLPSDFINLVDFHNNIRTVNNVEREKYRIEVVVVAGETKPSILTNETTVNIRYVYLEAGVIAKSGAISADAMAYLDLFDPDLREAFIAKLREELTYAVTRSASLTNMNAGISEREIDQAKASDQKDEGPDFIDDDILIRARW